jgi:hypothetical protein
MLSEQEDFMMAAQAYEEGHEHSVLQEFERLVLRDGVGKTMSRLGEETLHEIVDYYRDILSETA